MLSVVAGGLAGCAKEQAAEPAAVHAKVQALAETPRACGTSFEANYREQAIPSTGRRALVLPGLTARAWPKQLLHYRVRLPANGVAAQLVVRGPAPAEPVIAHQLDICSTAANGERVARLTFFADQPAGDADTTYTAGFETASVTPPATNATLTATAQHVELANAHLAVRTPPLGEQIFAGVDLESVKATVAPVLGYRLNGDATMTTQPSSFEGSRRKLTSLEVFQGASGSLFNEVLLAYEFAPANPNLPPGYWRVAIKVVHDIPMVFVEEEYDFGSEEPETSVDRWVLDLAKDWSPQTLTAAFFSSHDVLGPLGADFLTDASIKAIEARSLAASPAVDFPSLAPFLPSDEEQLWSGVRDGAGRFAGIVPLFGGAWRRYPKVAMHAQSGDVKLRFELGITTPKEPSYQLSTAGDDVALPRSTARRQWGLVLGAPKSNLELHELRARYGSLSMNDIKEWQLDWPGLDSLDAASYPRVLLTPAVAQSARSAFQSGSLPVPVREALAEFYATSGDATKAQAAAAVFDQWYASAHDEPFLFGRFAGVFSPLTHYIGGQSFVGDVLASIEDFLSWPGASQSDRRRVLRRVALLAHLYAHPELAPIVSGAHQGNPNMALNRLAALPLLTELIPNHPLAPTFRDFAFDYYRAKAESTLSTGGAFTESSTSYQNAGLPFIQYPLLAFTRQGRWFEPQALLENATHFQAGTLTPIVARYGIPLWEPFGNSDLTPVTSPLITAAIYHSRGLAGDRERAQQALKVWELGGSVCNDALTGHSGCMLAAYAAVLAPGNAQSVDRGSKLLPGLGVSLRGRPGTPEESFLLLRGGYHASHMDSAERGAFAFHTAGDELIGFPDLGYIKELSGNPWSLATMGQPWSRIESADPVSVNGEWSDTGFTALADYAQYQTNLTRWGYGSGAWVRQAMLIKGEQSGEHDYAVFRDSRPYRAPGTLVGQPISAVHLATRLPAASWSAGPNRADLSGRQRGRLRATLLEPASGVTPASALGIDYTMSERPLCSLRAAFAGGAQGRPESPTRLGIVETTVGAINRVPTPGCSAAAVSHSSLDFDLAPGALSASWLLQAGLDATPSWPPPAVATTLSEGVFKIAGNGGTDYVFLRDLPFEWTGSGADAGVAFRGKAGVVRVRGTQVTLALNAGTGAVSYAQHSLAGEGPLHCRTTTSAPASACATVPPSPPFAIPVVTGSALALTPSLTQIVDSSTQTTQYRVLSTDGRPVSYFALGPDGQRIAIDGIVDGAITISPYHTNFTVRAGTGLFTAGGQAIVGGAPFSVDRHPDHVEGESDGRPRSLWVDGLHTASVLEVDGVRVSAEEIGGNGVWLTSIGLTGGAQSFALRKLDNRLRSLPHLNYTLDRVTGRAIAAPREPPPGALVFSGYGSFGDSARWSPRPPAAGDTVFIPQGSGAALLADTPQLARLIVDGDVTVHSGSARLRATDVEICGTLTHAANRATAPGAGGAWPVDARVSIEATTFTLCGSGRIDVSNKGYQARQATAGAGAGPGGGQADTVHGAGAGHGGTGGRNTTRSLAGGLAYDDVLHPSQPGSAGGTSAEGSRGGAGGGVVRIVATGRATLDGVIAADGESAVGAESGGGAGGAIEISCSELRGSGLLRADGGGTHHSGGGGGGGRIAVHYASVPVPVSLRLSAGGGRMQASGGEDGEPGSVYLPDASFFPTTSVSDSLALVLGSSAPIRRSSLELRDDARLSLPSNAALQLDDSGALRVTGARTVLKLGGDTWAGSVDVRDGARLELLAPASAAPDTGGRFATALRVAGALQVRAGSTFVPRSDRVSGVSPQIFAQSVLVESGGQISADGTGFGGNALASGYGPGAGAHHLGYGSGGGHGGAGGASRHSETNGGVAYDSASAPDQPGSAGGGGNEAIAPGGAGGGLVHLRVAGSVQIDGTLSANGLKAPRQFDLSGRPTLAGGGAGGGIYLVCDTLRGSGAIRALGGATDVNGGSGGGGGGRIAIYRRVNSWAGEAIAAPASVAGGAADGSFTKPGAAGSVVIGSDAPLGSDPLGIFGAQLVAFYRSDSGVARDGSSRAEGWADRSLNGNHLTQSASSSRPSYVTTGRFPALAFRDNPTQWLEDALVSGGPVANQDGLYVWAVRRRTSGASDATHTYFSGSGGSGGSSSVFALANPLRRVDFTASVGGPQSITAMSATPASLDGAWHFNEGYFDLSARVAGALDGTVVATTSTPSSVVGTSLQRLDVGRQGSGPSADFQGELYELGLARVRPSSEQLAAMRAYLDLRYGAEPPLATITSPAPGASFAAPATIALAAQPVAHFRNAIARVEFYSGATLLGSDTSAPYTYSWSAVPLGSYSLSARAVDSTGLTGSSAAVAITVAPNTPPSGSITSPAPNAFFIKPPTGNASIPITVSASDPDGSVARVRFYGDSALLGEDLTPVYSTTWSTASFGPHTLSAIVEDNLGATRTTASVPIQVWQSQDIGAILQAGSASYAAPTFTVRGSGVGLDATIDGFHFLYKQVTGTSFTLTARVTGLIGTANARTGLMIRETLDPNARHASALWRPLGVGFHYRATPATPTQIISSGGSTPVTIRLTRNGNQFSVARLENGSWIGAGTPVTINMSNTVYVGLVTTNGSNASTATATLDNVSLP